MGAGVRRLRWDRLAEPQPDGYDTPAIALAARAAYGFTGKPARAEPPSWLGGTVPLVSWQAGPELGPAPFDHPFLAQAERLLALWPAMEAQCRALLTALGPTIRPGVHPDQPIAGCASGALGERWGSVMVSLESGAGVVAGIVHELGHWKLHALGVHLEHWDGQLLANDPAELYESPIRKDRRRPMGAVLQAHYSYLHVLDAELRMIAAGEQYTMLDVNAGRVAEGQATIRAHAQLTAPGREYVGACLAWGDRLLEEVAARGQAAG